MQKAAALLLPRRGLALRAAATPEEAWSILAAEPIDVVLLDLNFRPGAVSGEDGMRCLEGLVAHDPDAVIVVVTGHSGVNIAVAAMRAGATDFVMKPWNNDRLIATLTEAAALRCQRRTAHPDAGRNTPEDLLIGDSPPMRRLRSAMMRVAATDAPILLIGEAGVGKTLVARHIHRASRCAAAPLLTFDPGAIWREGEPAWAQATNSISNDATLFIDEFAALPNAAQMRLLNLLHTHPGLRQISATRYSRTELPTLVNADLLYALNTVELAISPLRDRGNDITLLAEHFLRLFTRRHARPPMALPPETAMTIAAHPWPGNIRALRQAIERAVVLTQRDTLLAEDILPALTAASLPTDASDLNLSRSEKAIVAAALQRHGFNVSYAARDLGVTRATLYRRMARHGL